MDIVENLHGLCVIGKLRRNYPIRSTSTTIENHQNDILKTRNTSNAEHNTSPLNLDSSVSYDKYHDIKTNEISMLKILTKLDWNTNHYYGKEPTRSFTWWYRISSDAKMNTIGKHGSIELRKTKTWDLSMFIKLLIIKVTNDCAKNQKMTLLCYAKTGNNFIVWKMILDGTRISHTTFTPKKFEWLKYIFLKWFSCLRLSYGLHHIFSHILLHQLYIIIHFYFQSQNCLTLTKFMKKYNNITNIKIISLVFPWNMSLQCIYLNLWMLIYFF